MQPPEQPVMKIGMLGHELLGRVAVGSHACADEAIKKSTDFPPQIE